MDITEIQNIAGWLVGLFATSVVTGIIGVYSIIKAGRMLPKELKSADLDIKSKEVDIANQYEELAEKAAQKVVRLQERLDIYESNQLRLSIGQEEMRAQIAEQNRIIKKQDKTIEKLRCEIDNYKLYTNALIAQIKKAQLIPIEMTSLELSACENDESDIQNKKVSKKK